MKRLALPFALAMALTTAAQAGGPVVIEEPEDLVAGDTDTRNKALPWILGAIGLAIILSSGSNGGGATCNQPETPDGGC